MIFKSSENFIGNYVTNRTISDSHDIKENILLSESRMRSNVVFALGENVCNSLLKAEKAMLYYSSRGKILE